MTEITSSGAPRVFVAPRGNRVYISRHDALIVLCSVCGGAISVVLHMQVINARVPVLTQCKCERR